jgi:hypothetical protein
VAVTRRGFLRGVGFTGLLALLPAWVRPRQKNGWVEREVTRYGDQQPWVMSFTRPIPTKSGRFTGRRFRVTGPGVDVTEDVGEGERFSPVVERLYARIPHWDEGFDDTRTEALYVGAYLIGLWVGRYN